MDCKDYPLDQIAPDPDQPRKIFDPAQLAELAESIRVNGVLQPIVLTPNPDPAAPPYLIFLGERRYRASLLAGRTLIPALLDERSLSPEERLVAQLAENDARKDLSLLERAEALSRLLAREALSRQELADKLGKSKSWLSHLLALSQLKGPAREAIAAGVVTHVETARRFASLSEPTQSHLLAHARSRGLPITATIVASAEQRDRRDAVEAHPTARVALDLAELRWLLSLAGLPLEPTLQRAAAALKNHLQQQVRPSVETP